ncbi:molybdopterin-guanine dinucleotide biosynthesis protein B [Bacillota bacterium Lsc_1132]
MVNPFIFQVVGYQNSGKTTVVTKLIKRLKNEGWEVAAIKHHGHGGRPEAVETKDSAKHAEAGAAVSIVEGAGRLILQADKPSWNLAEEIQLISFFQPDIILIEGHKKENYPKLLILREKKDLELLKFVNHVEIAFVWDEALQKQIESISSVISFHINDQQGMDWVAQFFHKQLNSVL